MNLYKFFIAICFAAILFLAHKAEAAVVVTEVTAQETADAFEDEMIWYAQFQPGGSPLTDPDNEFEFGNQDGIYYQGNTTITDEADNPFSVSVSSANDLSVIFNGVTHGIGDAMGITSSYNEIWVVLKIDTGTGAPNTIGVNSLEFDSASLPTIDISTDPGFFGFRFYDDQRTDNIGEMILEGNINPDMFFGFAEDDEWTLTVFGVNNPNIPTVPESSSILFVVFSSLMIVRRQR